jgi:hypothetical protein
VLRQEFVADDDEVVDGVQAALVQRAVPGFRGIRD